MAALCNCAIIAAFFAEFTSWVQAPQFLPFFLLSGSNEHACLRREDGGREGVGIAIFPKLRGKPVILDVNDVHLPTSLQTVR